MGSEMCIRDRPSLVMTDVTGNIVKVPLTTAVDAKSSTITTQSAFITSAVSTAPRSLARMRTTSQPAKTTTVIPHILLASNLAGNEENTVPAGFVLAGDIKLFGGLNAELYTFHGTAGDEKSAMVMLSQSPVSMDALLASPGVVFGDIMLQHPELAIYSKTTTSGRDAGLWLDAALKLDGSFSNVATILKDVLAVSVGSIDVSVHLGGYQSFTDAFKAPSDVLITASLPTVDVKIGQFLVLSTVQVDIHGVNGTSGYAWDISLKGNALFTVPGSIAPLASTYTISKGQSTYTLDLTLSQGVWSDAMGVPGFHLDNTDVKATFTSDTKDKAFTFDITADFHLGTTLVAVTGSYASDQWGFHATVGDFNLQQLESAYTQLFKADLAETKHNVAFTGFSLDVNSKDKTLLLKGGVNVDKYTSATAALSLTSTGVLSLIHI